MLLQILLATVGISALSLVGVLLMGVKEKHSQFFLLSLVALSAGTMMGGAFLHLLPESLEFFEGSLTPFLLVLLSFVGFFMIEKVLHWRHCHDEDCHVHSFGYLNLLGDAVHNFIDGLVIAATFATGNHLGWATVLAIALHEIPQEIGDFGVLLHAGFSRTKAIAANVAVSLTAVAGGVLGYIVAMSHDSLVPYLLPIAAGGFLYVSCSDLIPELLKERKIPGMTISLLLFVVGIGIMYVTAILGE